MGEVYKARDTRLDRTVAIKVLPAHLADDAEFRERFEQEAKSISQLAHPNICTLHDIGQVADVHFLVLEFLEGETLADRLARGPLPVTTALRIASEIASALNQAHRLGIVHRDLKPGNVFLSSRGPGSTRSQPTAVAGTGRGRHADEHLIAKLLDFGLAKVAAPAAVSNNAVTAAVTAAGPLTARGTILGTMQYMSPEQIEGADADARTDIFAFGAVLFEMLTGRKAFQGKSETSLLAAILNEDPPTLNEIQNAVPPALDYLVRACLAKDPDARVQTAHDIWLQLKWIAEGGSGTGMAVTPDRSRPRRERAIWAAVLIAVATLAATAAWRLKPSTMVPRVVARFQYPLPETQTFTGFGRHVVAISPDGTKLVYVANRQLYLRELNRLESEPIRGTLEAPAAPLEPVFSPDGQSVAYFTTVSGGMVVKRVPIAGGTPIILGRVSGGPLGVTWRNHTIAFGRGAAGIEALPDTGGEARTIASVDAKTERAVQPELLDGGQYVVFAVPTPLDTGRESATGEGPIVVQPLAGGARKVLVPVGANPRVLSSGQLVYLHDRTIFGIPFDARRVEVTGDPVALVENVTQTGASSAGQFGVSQTGSLVYVTAGSMDPQRSLVWVDRQGQEQTLPAAANSYQQPRISPDGGRFVVSDSANIWIWSFASETLMRLTNDAAVHYNPAWTPDGRRVVYDSNDGRGTQILRKAADGTGAAEVVAPAPAGFPEIVSPDEKYLVYHVGQRISMLLPMNPRGPARRLLPDVKGQVSDAEISPNGRWIAYESDESGRFDIYVRPFPDVDTGRWQISSSGGTHPLWSRSGRELFFIAGDGMMTSVPIRPGSAFAHERPVGLFPAGQYYVNVARNYDVSSDGKRFLFVKTSTGTRQSIIVVSHWIDEVRARMTRKD